MKKYEIREENTVDLWFNEDGHEGELLITYGGENPKDSPYNSYNFNKIDVKNVEQIIDEMLGVLGRDIENWHTYNVVIHWGVHNWRFTNDYNIID